MGFFAALGRLLRSDPSAGGAAPGDRARLLEAWGLSDTSHPEFPGAAPAADPEEMAAPPATTDYDRATWRRKLGTLLSRLPDSQSQWDDFMADVGALNLDPEWVRQAQREEFILMLRRAVADRTITPLEHRNLELARTLIGLPESEATALLEGVVTEAESFFGGAIDRGPAKG
jgi:hypothetical protein